MGAPLKRVVFTIPITGQTQSLEIVGVYGRVNQVIVTSDQEVGTQMCKLSLQNINEDYLIRQREVNIPDGNIRPDVMMEGTAIVTIEDPVDATGTITVTLLVETKA